MDMCLGESETFRLFLILQQCLDALTKIKPSSFLALHKKM